MEPVIRVVGGCSRLPFGDAGDGLHGGGEQREREAMSRTKKIKRRRRLPFADAAPKASPPVDPVEAPPAKKVDLYRIAGAELLAVRKNGEGQRCLRVRLPDRRRPVTIPYRHVHTSTELRRVGDVGLLVVRQSYLDWRLKIGRAGTKA